MALPRVTAGASITTLADSTNRALQSVDRRLDQLRTNVVRVTDSHQASFGDFIVADTSQRPVRIALPSIRGDDVGFSVVVRKISSANLAIVSASSGQTIWHSSAVTSFAIGASLYWFTFLAISTTEWVIGF
jgi:hypothetical protein